MTPLYADMVWPALVLEQRILSVIPITAGLVVEWLALWLGGFGLSWKKAVIVDVVMNAVSSAVGVVLIPALGFGWEYFAEFVLSELSNVGTFNWGTWAVTFVIAVLATTGIEAFVVRWGFKVPLGRRRFWILCASNCVSVAIAFVSLWMYPPKF